MNGRRARSHQAVRPGDRLEITTGPGRRRQLVVRGLADRSIRKADARRLYEDVTPPPTEEVLEAGRLERLFGRESRGGRPDRKERRERRRRKGW